MVAVTVFSSGQISKIVYAGNHFAKYVMDQDQLKISISREQMEVRLNSLLTEFLVSSELNLKIKIGFCDVHALMGQRFHTELAYIISKDGEIKFLFHERLLSFEGRYAGLIFVAKSWVLALVLAGFNERNGLVDFEFVFEIGDNATLDQVAFTTNNPGACLILDYDFAAADGYAEFRRVCNSQFVPWERRADKIFWRGSTTGQRLRPPPMNGEDDEFLWLPRLHLCHLVKTTDLIEHCDVGITNIVQIDEPHVQARIKSADLLRDRVEREYFMMSKGVFDIDGNANAWSGLFCSLLGGSCVLKVASNQGIKEWYYGDLKAWQHYVPIDASLSDLKEKVQWFMSHDHLVREIGVQGREFANWMTTTVALYQSVENLEAWLMSRNTKN